MMSKYYDLIKLPIILLIMQDIINFNGDPDLSLNFRMNQHKNIR